MDNKLNAVLASLNSLIRMNLERNRPFYNKDCYPDLAEKINRIVRGSEEDFLKCLEDYIQDRIEKAIK